MSMSPSDPPVVAPTIDYARPAQFAPPADVYREGRLIVAPRESNLPSGCVHCAGPEATRLRRTLYWHHPAIYVALILIGIVGILLYVVLSLALRKRGTVTFGLCRRHARRRLVVMVVGSIATVGLLALGIALSVEGRRWGVDRDVLPFAILGSFLGFVACLLVVRRSATPLVAKRIDDFQMRLKGAGEPYLAELSFRGPPDVPPLAMPV